MAPLPSSLALSGWPVDGSAMVAAAGRTDLAAIQTAVNALITALASGTSGQVLTSGGASAISFGAAQAMTQICDSTAGGAVASFDTNTILGGNIPSAYNHLKLVFEGRGDTAAASTTVTMRVNNDSAANYEHAVGYMTGAAVYSGNGVGGGTGAQVAGHMAAATATAGATGAFELTLAQYNSATLWRRWMGTGGSNDGANIWLETIMGSWRNAANAITRLSLTPGAGNFVAGSRFTLYGML
jgi:hypothetical protein